MNVSSSPASLTLTPQLELRTTPVVHVETGTLVALETRLFRRVAGAGDDGAFLPTGAGFRIPSQLVGQYVQQLLAFARSAP